MATERDRLEAAGQWLREQRERHGFPTAGRLARAIDADPSLVSRIESGTSKATDERAAKIAEVFGMDVVEVRRNLGLWVPPESGDGTWSPSPELQEALDRLRRSREEFLEEAERVEKLLTDHAQRPEAPSEHAATDRDEEEAERRRGA